MVACNWETEQIARTIFFHDVCQVLLKEEMYDQRCARQKKYRKSAFAINRSSNRWSYACISFKSDTFCSQELQIVYLISIFGTEKKSFKKLDDIDYESAMRLQISLNIKLNSTFYSQINGLTQ